MILQNPVRLLKKYWQVIGGGKTDGCDAYEELEIVTVISLLDCFAHARLNFFEAKTANAQLSNEVLELFAKVCALEKHIREHNLTGETKMAYRLEHPIIVLDALHA